MALRLTGRICLQAKNHRLCKVSDHEMPAEEAGQVIHSCLAEY